MRQTDSPLCRALNLRDNSDLVLNKNAKNKIVAKIIDAKRDFLENVICHANKNKRNEKGVKQFLTI